MKRLSTIPTTKTGLHEKKNRTNQTKRRFNNFVFLPRFNIVPYQESKSIDPLFYSINYKSLHLISFSSEFYFDQNTQTKYPLDWLEADLDLANRRRHLQPWIVFMTHRPLYCSGNSSSCHMPSVLSSIEPILLKHKVDIYMCKFLSAQKRTIYLPGRILGG
jgi:hypothetical protein